MAELIAQKREILGKKVDFLRRQGLIPAELYGHKIENINLSVSAKDFLRVFKEAGESTVIKLKVEITPTEVSEFNVLVNDFQENPLTNEVSHIDFYSVKMDEKITAKIPLKFINEPPAVKEKNGVLVKAMHEIEIEALPADLLHHIEIDLSGLSDIGMSIYVKDLKVNKKVRFLVNSETVVATITEMAKEEVLAEPVNVEEVKVEGEEKKKEREEKKEKDNRPAA
ncbi:MAG: 50S ribosomal protein L25 [Patescibacteria group bacterium]